MPLTPQGLGPFRQLWSLTSMLRGRYPLKSPWARAALVLPLVYSTPLLALEGEWTAGGLAGATASTRLGPSPVLALRAGYGLTSAWDVQLEAAGAWWRDDAQEPVVVQLVPSLVYKFDVLRWVPYLRAGAGGFMRFSDDTSLGAAVVGGVGVEYLLDRSFSLGTEYQAQWLVDEARAMPAHRLTLSATWRSGW